jgi:hypothetical protein
MAWLIAQSGYPDIHEARLKPLGWSSSIGFCAAGEKNPAFGLLAAIYASGNQVSLPQFRRFELAVLPLESPAQSANFVNRTSATPCVPHAHFQRINFKGALGRPVYAESTELDPQKDTA